MNRFNWTYLGDNGKRHHVGLLHGPKSGHLLVYCGTKILLIDFKVLHTSTYSFFIDGELCEITIERKGNEDYLYGFDINKKADTPRNRQRKRIEKRHMLQSLTFLAAFIFIVAAFLYGFRQFSPDNSRPGHFTQLRIDGQETNAKVLINTEGEGPEISYFFIVNGTSYSGLPADTKSRSIISKNGMPLESGDEFIVTYLENNPDKNEIDYSRPSKKQVDLYRDRAIEKHLHINEGVSRHYASCLVDIAYEFKGIKGIADVFFQDATPLENENNNQESFSLLFNNQRFQKMLADRCATF